MATADVLLDNSHEDPRRRAPLVLGEPEFGAITEQVCAIVEKPKPPRVWYVAFGISGAVHHVMGMSGAGKVVVVNRDPNALFFGHADHGAVADAIEILPLLIAEMGG